MPKNKLKTLALLMAVPFIFTACTLQDLPVIGGLFGGGAKQPITLTVWGLWESPEVIAPIIEKYQTQFPHVTINYEDLSVLKLNDLVEYKSRIFTRAGQEEWDVDIMMVHNSWVERLQPFLSELPSDEMTLEEYTTKFYPVAASSSIFGGEAYAIPAFYDGLALVYNKAHFEEIGQSAAPTAWEEFRKLALDLTQRAEDGKGDIIRAGAAIGSANNIDHFSDILGLMWSQAGVSIPGGLGSASAQDALSFYTSFLTEHRVWREDFPEALTSFKNGQVSMIFVPSWQVLSILSDAPNLDIGVAPVPQALPVNPVTWGSFWVYSVPSSSDSKSEAWKFLNFLSQEEQQLTLFSQASLYRPFGAPFSLISLLGELENDPYLGSVVRTAPFAASGEIAARSGNRRQVNALKDAVNKLIEGRNDVTVESVLIEARDIINQ